MHLFRGSSRVAGALALALLAPAALRAQTSGPVTYVLSGPPSEFEWGCFAPCECPIMVRSPLSGTFTLRFSHSDPLFSYYDVLNVRWSADDSGQPVVITGSGVYRRGGEVAESEQMTLDLSFGGRPARRFDSGLVPPRAVFPEIALDLSLHGEYCLDSALVVDAKPLPGTAGVGEGEAPALTVTPNPTRAAADVGFALGASREVDLAIFDTAGRRLRTLIAREPLPAGLHHRTWDGRLESGAEAPAGLYVVKLVIGGRQVSRGVVKLR